MTFRKGEILHGLAPTDAIDTPLRSVLNVFQRIAAWKSHLPLSRRPQEVMNERYRAFSAEPIAASYRVDLYLAEDIQMSLDFEEPGSAAPFTG